MNTRYSVTKLEDTNDDIDAVRFEHGEYYRRIKSGRCVHVVSECMTTNHGIALVCETAYGELKAYDIGYKDSGCAGWECISEKVWKDAVLRAALDIDDYPLLALFVGFLGGVSLSIILGVLLLIVMESGHL